MKIDIQEDDHHIYLAITHNGYQWTALTLKSLNDLSDIKDHIEEYILEKEENKIYELKRKKRERRKNG